MKEKIQQIYNNLNSLNITSSRTNCTILLSSMNLLQEVYDEILNSENKSEDTQEGE